MVRCECLDMSVSELGVFAKYWHPGAVKTRLAAMVGDVSAAEVYRAGLELLVHRCGRLAARRTLVYWPPERARVLPAGGDAVADGTAGRG